MNIPNLHKRNGIYYFKAKIGGKQIWRSLHTRDATEAMKNLVALDLDSENGSDRGLLVSEFVTVWIREFVRFSRNEKGVHLAKQRLRDFILPSMGDVALREVGSLHMRALRGLCEERGISLQTVRHVMSDCRAMLNAAVEAGEIPHSPFNSKLMPKIPETVARSLSNEEVDAILSKSRAEYRVAIELALSTGMRWGELRDLNWSHIRWSPYPHARLGLTKAKKTRSVPLTPVAVKVLKEISARWGNEGHVLPARPNHPGNFVARIGKAVGFKWNFHLTRHTFCTRWLEEGGSKEILRLILGHSTIRLIETTYGHLTDEAVFLEVQRLTGEIQTAASLPKASLGGSEGYGFAV